MNFAHITAASAPGASTSLSAKLCNLLASPAEVFDELVIAPPAAANWRTPTLLVCLAGVVVLHLSPTRAQSAAAIQHLIEAGTISADQAEFLAGVWPLASGLAVCLAAFGGTLWAAFVLWFMGRVFLKARFRFLKALEVVGLTGIILLLGTVVTCLLIATTGDATAHPSLALLAGKLDSSHVLRKILDLFDVFHLWATAVLALGLSRLTGVTFKEAVFWVFGYWLLARIALALLA